MIYLCRSQWPRGLRHEMSSPAWTLGSWVRIPLEAWMFAFIQFVLSCVGSGLATGRSLVQGVLPTVYMCKIMESHKEEAKARYGLQRRLRRRMICLYTKFYMSVFSGLVCDYKVYSVQWYEDWWMRNWKGFARKRPLPKRDTLAKLTSGNRNMTKNQSGQPVSRPGLEPNTSRIQV
jgi:hypothetical protein